MAKSKIEAVAYFRTSSATNVGFDKDSLSRQQSAVAAYAKANKIQIVAEFYDAAVSGADHVGDRPGFAAMLVRIEGNGVSMILIEDASRFARDLAVQLAGHDLLKRMGVELVPVNAPDHFREDTPTAVLVRNVLGCISEFEKASLVARLKGARDRKAALTGRPCGGRKRVPSEAIKAARKLARQGKGHRLLSYGKIAAGLAAAGHGAYASQSVKLMLSPAQQAARQR